MWHKRWWCYRRLCRRRRRRRIPRAGSRRTLSTFEERKRTSGKKEGKKETCASERRDSMFLLYLLTHRSWESLCDGQTWPTMRKLKIDEPRLFFFGTPRNLLYFVSWNNSLRHFLPTSSKLPWLRCWPLKNLMKTRSSELKEKICQKCFEKLLFYRQFF